MPETFLALEYKLRRGQIDLEHIDFNPPGAQANDAPRALEPAVMGIYSMINESLGLYEE